MRYGALTSSEGVRMSTLSMVQPSLLYLGTLTVSASTRQNYSVAKHHTFIVGYYNSIVQVGLQSTHEHISFQYTTFSNECIWVVSM
jgi:hypothetical protein